MKLQLKYLSANRIIYRKLKIMPIIINVNAFICKT